MSGPHTRGDVPSEPTRPPRTAPWSPHAWGCTVWIRPVHGIGHVVPTRVGMYRKTHHQYADRCTWSPHAWGCTATAGGGGRGGRRGPHTRGDVPSGVTAELLNDMWSPHAWGCTVDCIRQRFRRNRGPHTRGDVPTISSLSSNRTSWSPHAWGCTVWVRPVCGIGHVVPTRVGMYRTPTPAACAHLRGPHTRGDVPVVGAVIVLALWVVPTRVGMYRYPMSEPTAQPQWSPHAWGCTVLALPRPVPMRVVPTRVGMYRWDCLIRS